MISPARRGAYAVLRAVHSDATDLGHAIARVRGNLRDDRDRALAGEIAIGTLRWRGRLDHLIAHFARRPIAKLDPEVLDVLRLSAYQLLHLERVPPAAIVNDAVNLVGQVKKRSAAPFVNGVLRALDRSRDRLPLPTRPPAGAGSGPADAGRYTEQALDYLSVTLSHPRWLVARWLDRYGFDATEAWLTFNNGPAPLALRTNPLKTDRAALVTDLATSGVGVESARYAPDALIVTAGSALQTRAAAEGHFLVQDEASQLVAMMAGVRPNQAVLDTCAAPGGKATAFAAAMNGRGTLVAADARGGRIRLLRDTLARAGASAVRVVQADLLQPAPFAAVFDWVIVDAPCSGLGTLRRDPDIKWRRQEEDLETLAEAERTILAHAAGAVGPGGRLLYATCSSEPEEDEQIVASFLATHADFESVDLGRSDDCPAALRPVLNDAGVLRTLPHVHGLEAFFGAVLQRVVG
jgi:16S rRNA (cytosine967-C5)-methyltransferase